MSLKKYLTEAAQAKQQPVTGNTINFNINGIKDIKATVVEHVDGKVVIEMNDEQLAEFAPIIAAAGGALARGAAAAGGALARGAAKAAVGTGIKAAANKLDKAMFGPSIDNDDEPVREQGFEDEEVEYMPQVGDVVMIDYPTHHEGEMGEVVELSPSGDFAYVEFKNGDIQSYNASDLVKVSDEEAYAYMDQEEHDDDDFDESINSFKRLAGMPVAEAPAAEYDTSPGSPYDRGQADAYYGRRGNPTKVIDKPDSTVRGERMIVPLTDPEEIKAYYAGYEGTEFGEKDYGSFPDYSDDDVDESFADFTTHARHSGPYHLKNVIVMSPSGKTYTFDNEKEAHRMFGDKWSKVKDPNSGWSVDMSKLHEAEAAMNDVRRLAGMNEAPAKMGSYLGISALRAPPLKNYRPAMWENMFGTVYAMNDAGEVKYFDYDHDAAKAFAGIGPDSAPRLYRVDRHAYGKTHGEYRYGGEDDYASPSHGKLVLWIKKNAAPTKTPEEPSKEATNEISEPVLNRYVAKATRQGTSKRFKGVTTALGKLNAPFGWRGNDVKIPAGKDMRPKDTWDESVEVYVKESTGELTKLTLPTNLVSKNNTWSCNLWTKK